MTSLQATAQVAQQRTTLARATELVAEHLSRARREQDLALRQQMFTEVYVAKLSLPTEDDLRLAAQRLKEIGRGSWAVDITPFFQDDAEWQIIELNKQRYDPTRVRHVVLALLGNHADDELRKYDYERLVKAGKREEVAAAVASDYDPYRQLARLCRDGKPDLAGYAAAKLTGAKWADITVGIMAELGMTADAERRALQYVPRTDSRGPSGLSMLGNLAVTEAHRGRRDAVQRLTRMILGAPDADSITNVSGSSGFGPCEEKLWNEWPNWKARSVFWQSLPRSGFNVYPESGAGRSLAAALGEALAGTGMNATSLGLIDPLIGAIDRATAASEVGPMPTGTDQNAVYAWMTRRDRHQAVVRDRKALMLARIAAGAEVDDAAANALTVKAAIRFLYEFPHSQLSARILSFSAIEQRRLEQADPDLAAGLRYVALLRQGRGQEAHSLGLAHPRMREQIHDITLQDIVASLQNAGLVAEAKAMIDAYLEARYRPDLIDIHLLLAQERADKAKSVLRNFVSTSYDTDVFIGVMLLRELGEPIDAAALTRMLGGDPSQKIDNWIAAIDALAWSAASDEIGILLRNPPNEMSALSPDEAARTLCTAYGLQAVSLARAGQLEAGLRLVTERTLKQRDYGCKGDMRPVFDLRYLVQQWIERGHAH